MQIAPISYIFALTWYVMEQAHSRWPVDVEHVCPIYEWGAHQAWLLALISDYLCQSNPETEKKLAEERGLFDRGGG